MKYHRHAFNEQFFIICSQTVEGSMQWCKKCGERKFQSSIISPFSFIKMLLILQCMSDTHDYLDAKFLKTFILISFREFRWLLFQLHFLFTLNNAQQSTVGNNFYYNYFSFFQHFYCQAATTTCATIVSEEKNVKIQKLEKINVIVIFYGRVVSLPFD